MKIAVLLTALLVAILPRLALTWNIPGHMLSAEIAHQILQQESLLTIDKVKAVLALHPWHSTRWQNSRAPFAGADSDTMLLMLAARWADDIRANDKAEHRGPWHYVNMPFKPQGQPAHIQTKPAGIPNILTTLEENGKIAGNDPDPQKRAIALAWLFHLVGDIHQPLHTSQLFSVEYPSGDQVLKNSVACVTVPPCLRNRWLSAQRT